MLFLTFLDIFLESIAKTAITIPPCVEPMPISNLSIAWSGSTSSKSQDFGNNISSFSSFVLTADKTKYHLKTHGFHMEQCFVATKNISDALCLCTCLLLKRPSKTIPHWCDRYQCPVKDKPVHWHYRRWLYDFIAGQPT